MASTVLSMQNNTESPRRLYMVVPVPVVLQQDNEDAQYAAFAKIDNLRHRAW